MAVKVPIRAVFDGSTATGLAEYQSGEFIALAYGGLGASLSIGSAGQILKVNDAADALEFAATTLDIDGLTDGSGVTLATSDKLIFSDGGTEKYMTVATLNTFFLSNTQTLTNKTLTAPTITGTAVMADLDISGDVDVDGTLEADAITIAGVTLSETIADTVGAMVSSNTETGITVTYQDSDNTIDFVVGTLNQDTTGLAGTATALATARTIGGTSFDGTANIAVALAAEATILANARTIGGTSFDGSANIAVALATLATTVTITDNESTNENNAIIFTAGGDLDGGNLGLESDGDLYYNPNTSTLTVPNVSVSDLTGSSQISSDSFNLPITLNGTDGSSTNAGDNIVQNTAANENDRIVYEDATPTHSERPITWDRTT